MGSPAVASPVAARTHPSVKPKTRGHSRQLTCSFAYHAVPGTRWADRSNSRLRQLPRLRPEPRHRWARRTADRRPASMGEVDQSGTATDVRAGPPEPRGQPRLSSLVLTFTPHFRPRNSFHTARSWLVSAPLWSRSNRALYGPASPASSSARSLLSTTWSSLKSGGHRSGDGSSSAAGVAAHPALLSVPLSPAPLLRLAVVGRYIVTSRCVPLRQATLRRGVHARRDQRYRRVDADSVAYAVAEMQRGRPHWFGLHGCTRRSAPQSR